ncbi:MAG: hypothetical protein HQL60_03800, partial [Magnetococcales bacterium]|nr:hypothetical protein [Magnetococcales bacterium]
MTVRMGPIPYHIAKNVGFALLLAILFGVVAVAYHNTNQANRNIHLLIDYHAPQLATLEHIKRLVLDSHTIFTTIAQTEPPTFNDVLSSISLLLNASQKLEQALADQGLAVTQPPPSKTIARARAALIRHNKEEMATGDMTNDTSAILLVLVEKLVATSRGDLVELMLESKLTSSSPLLHEQKRNCQTLLVAVETELYRYIHRPHVSIQDGINLLQQAVLLLDDFNVKSHLIDPEITLLIHKLGHALRQFKIGLLSYQQEVSRSGYRSDSVDSVKELLHQIWKTVELALHLTQQHLIGYVHAIEARILADGERGQKIFVALSVSGLALFVAI